VLYSIVFGSALQETNCYHLFSNFVEFEAAHNLLVAIVLIESDKAVLDQVLKTLVSEPAQKTNIKFKVYVVGTQFYRHWQ